MIKDKKILISGAKGFVGSQLVRELHSSNEVIGIDNLLHAPNPTEYPTVRYLNTDVKTAIDKLSSERFDLFFHFGEYSRVEQSVAEPMIAFENSSSSILKVIEFCIGTDVKLIYSGSSTKFATYHRGAASPYATFKKLNTELINSFGNYADLNYAIAYFYNIYGPGESRDPKYGTVIQKFLDLCATQPRCVTLPVVSPGTQLRNFTHIYDTISALLLIAEHGSGDGYGICAEESYSVLEVVEMLGRQPDWLTERSGNRDQAVNMSCKTKKLGWRQKYDLKSYLREKLNEMS
ncbi:NAD-dependent epimerase/dehydratase family protein [Planktomarina temperata]|nr:NAD-dependent epimerase/dehydratase family protein [Planktomarina temperata]MDC1094979.1 NAD-dependent epimerase/dehydratase family protein [Planktomarina temperata]